MATFELNVKINGVEQTVSTIGGLEKALAETNKQLTQVEENSKEFKFLTNQASNLEKVMTGLTADTQQFNQQLNNTNKAAKELNTSFQATAQVASTLDGNAVKNLENGVKTASNSAQSLRAELRQVVQELQQLEPGSARFQELSVRAGELRDTIGDTNAVVTALAGSTTERLGKALSSTAQVGIAGFQGIAAAQALFGSESEAINETMVKLTALLNLSQAIETFGGLGDRITEITAGFKSLFPAAASAATATTAAATATAAEGVAATGAAVGTTAFGVALNALPLVAIVTALGLLVAGLINYAAGADEASKADEERKKKLEEQKQAIDSVVSSTAKEGAGLVLLLSRLKATTAGTQERAKLLAQINADYGLTLKNLKDETAFQDQTTKAVNDYVAALKNKVAAQLIQAEIEKLVEKQLNNQRELDKLQRGNTFNSVLYNKNLTEQFDLKAKLLKQTGIEVDGFTNLNNKFQTYQINVSDGAKANLDASNKRIAQINKENDEINKQIQNLGVEAQKYAVLIGDVFEGVKTGAQNTKNSLEDVKRKQDEVLNNLAEFVKRANEAEIDLQRQRVQRTADRIDDLEFEKDIQLAKILSEYEAQKKAIEDNIKDAKKRDAALKTLETNYALFKATITQSTTEKENEEYRKRLIDQRKFLQQLAEAEAGLQKEITFGNNNTADTLASLQQRLLKLQIDRVDQELKSNELSVTDYEAKQKERLALQELYNRQQKTIDREQAITERDFQIAEIVKYYESLEKFNIEYNDKTGEYTVKATDKYLKESTELNKDAGDTATKEAQSVQNVINQSKINLNEETNVKLEEADSRYETNRKNNAFKTDEEILQNRLSTYSKILQVIEQYVNAASEIENLRVQNEEQNLIAKNEAFISGEQAKADAIEAAYQKDIEMNNYTEEQKTERRKQADDDIAKIQKDTDAAVEKANKELAMKQFKRQKALNIANAVINGAQAVLQAIAQFGPPPSPLGIAGIAAAGIITAAQIAAISSQKFDGGSTGITGVTTPTIADTTTPSVATGQQVNNIGGGFTSFTSTATGGGQQTGPTFTPFQSDAQKVYVLESDITATQRRVQVLEGNSTFG
jgi:hypothetical protein